MTDKEMIAVICPGCGAKNSKPLSGVLRGRKARCPFCLTVFVIDDSPRIVACEPASDMEVTVLAGFFGPPSAASGTKHPAVSSQSKAAEPEVTRPAVPLQANVTDPEATRFSAPCQLSADTEATRITTPIKNEKTDPEATRLSPPEKAVSEGPEALRSAPTVSGAPVPIPAETEEAATEQEVRLVWKPGELILDTYRVDGILGQGAFGTVYKVRHLGWNMDLAVKTPHPEVLDAHGADIFTAEAETWSELGLHPHIVSCYYVRNLGGAPRAFAEYVDGGSLQDLIEKGELEALDRKLDIAIQFAWGLAYAHAQNLVHKDVKPANVMLTADGRAKVTDFGLTRAKGGRGVGEKVEIGGGRTVLVDGVGCTPAYAAPEQLSGGMVSRAADAWSFAVSMLAMFTGGARWRVGAAAPTVLEELLSRPDAEGPRIPEKLAALLRACFVVEPDKRLRDMGAIAERLIAVYREVTGKDYPRQVPRLDQALSADSLVNRALSQLDLGHRDRAVSLLQEALKLQPHHPEATYNLGLLHWRTGEIFDTDLVTMMEEVRRSHASAWIDELLLSHVHLERGDVLAAHEVLAEADPEQPEIRQAREQLPALDRYRPFEVPFKFSFTYGRRIDASCIDPQGALLLSNASGHRLTRVDVRSGAACFEPFDQPHDFNGEQFVACCPEKGLIAAANITGRVLLFDAASRKLIRELQPEQGEPLSKTAAQLDNRLCFCGQGRKLVGLLGGLFHIWNLEDGGVQKIEPEKDKPFEGLACNWEGKYVLLTSGARGEVLNLISGERKSIPTAILSRTPMAFSPDGTQAFMISLYSKKFPGEKVLMCRHSFTEQCEELFRHGLNQYGNLATSPSADCLLLSGGHASFAGYFFYRIFEISTGRCLFTRIRKGAFHSTALLNQADGGGLQVTEVIKESAGLIFSRRVLAPSHRAPLAICRVRTSETLEVERSAFERNMSQALRAYENRRFGDALQHLQSARAIKSFERDAGAVSLWQRLCHRLTIGPLRGAWLEAEIPDGMHERMSLTAGGNRCLFFRWENNNNCAYWTNLESGETFPVRRFDPVVSLGGQAWLSCDRVGLLYKDTFEDITVIDSETGRVVCRSKTGKESGRLRAVSPDGAFFLVGFVTRNASLWCARTGRLLRTLPIKGHLLAAGFSWGGEAALLHTQGDGLVRWDIASGAVERYSLPTMGNSFHLCVQPQGGVAILGESKRVHLLVHYDPVTGTTKETVIPERGAGEAHPGIGLCPDGKTLAICCEQGKVVLWDLDAWKQVAVLRLPLSGINTQFARDPCRLLTCGKSVSFKTTGIAYALDWELHELTPDGLDRAAALMQAFCARQTGRGAHLPLDGELDDAVMARALHRDVVPSYGPVDIARLRVEIAFAGYGDWPGKAIETKLLSLAPEIRPCPLNALLTSSSRTVDDPRLLVGARVSEALDMIDFYREQGISTGESVLAVVLNEPGISASAWLIVTDAKLRIEKDSDGLLTAHVFSGLESLSVGHTPQGLSLQINSRAVAEGIPVDLKPALAALLCLIRDVVQMLEGRQVAINGAVKEFIDRPPLLSTAKTGVSTAPAQPSTTDPEATRLSHIGASINSDATRLEQPRKEAQGGHAIAKTGEPEVTRLAVTVPANATDPEATRISAPLRSSADNEATRLATPIKGVTVPDGMPDALVNTALSELDRGRRDQAVALLYRVLYIQPHHPEASYHLGLLRWRAGEISDMDLICELKEVRSSHKQNWTANLALGLVHMERGDYGSAAAALEAIEGPGKAIPQVIEALETSRSLLSKCADYATPWWNIYKEQPVMQPAEFCAFADDRTRVILPFSGKPLADVLETASGRRIQRLETKRGKCFLAAALNPDGRLALTGSDGMAAELWNVETGECLKIFADAESSGPRSGGIYGVHINRDAEKIITCGVGVREWDIATGKCLRTFDAGPALWRKLSVSRDETILAAATAQGQVGIWDLISGNGLQVWHTNESMLAIACDNQRLISGNSRGFLQVWNVQTGKCLGELKACRQTALNISLHNNGWLIAAGGGFQGPLILWDIREGQCLRTYAEAAQGSFSERKVIGSIFDDTPEARVFELQEKMGTVSMVIRNFHSIPAPGISCRIAGNQTDEETLREYAKELGKAKQSLADGDFPEMLRRLSAARSRSGCSREPGAVRLSQDLSMRLPRGTLAGAWQTLNIQGYDGGSIGALAIDSTGTTIVSSVFAGAGEKHAFKVWDAASGDCRMEFGELRQGIGDIRLTPDGRQLLAPSAGNRDISVWELQTGRIVNRLEDSQGVGRVDSGPDGRFAFGAYNQGQNKIYQVNMWNLAAGKLLRTFKGHTRLISASSISDDGSKLVSCGANEKLILWDVATGLPLRTFDVGWPQPQIIHFFPGGQTLFYLGGGGLALFDLHEGKISGQIKGMGGSHPCVALTSDGRYALSGHYQIIHLCDLRSMTIKRSFEGHRADVSALAVSRDGRFFVSGDRSGNIRVWNLDWELEPKEPADWDDAAEPFVRDFLTRQRPYSGTLPAARNPSDEELTAYLTRRGKPVWTEADFNSLIHTLQCAGFGWLRSEGVRKKLETLAAEI